VRISLALAVLLLTGRVAMAAPLVLEVDDCPHSDASEDVLRKQGAEHYARGETLYLQGDYSGAVSELVASYCTIPSFGYSILKDIGQAYERALDYERAVAYLQRYIDDMPKDAKRASPCAPEPAEDRENVRRRISVLKRLEAHILIQTQPGRASIAIARADDGRIVKRGASGDSFALEAGDYVAKISLRGHDPVDRPFTAHIGTPDTFSLELIPQTGKLSIQATPGDAKIYLDDGRVERLVGVGRYEAKLDAKKYRVRAERPGRLDDNQDVEVLPDRVTQVGLELAPRPQFGRRQLIAASTVTGLIATGNLLNAFGQTGITAGGSIAGGAAGAVFSYLYIPDDLALGTSNLTITSTLGGAVAGFATALLFTDNDNVVAPITGATMVAAGASGYYLGEKTKIKPGDAALINSAISWGTVSGVLFAESFGPGRRVYAGLVLSGLGMGTISGTVMTRYFEISRTHAILIDVGGVIGILGGLAVESLVYGASNAATDPNDRFTEAEREHIANFSLGGMAVGLIGAGILTRNIDAPKLPVQPALGTASTASGGRTTTFGLGGSW